MSTASRPSGRRYSMGAHGHSETSERFGNFLLQSGCGTEVWKPSYNDGVTTVRFFPGKNPDDPNNWDPFRLGDEPRQFGDWIRRYPAVRSMGDPGATFIIKDPADDSIQLEMTPAWVLYNAINRAVNQKSDPGWGGYLKGGQGRGAQLPRPGEVYLAQCCIVQHKGKLKSPFYGAADDKHVVLEMGTSAGKALLDLCDAPVEGYQGPPENYDARFQSGDIVDPAGGRYVTFYSLKGGDPRQGRNTALTAAAAFGGGGGRQNSGGGGRDEDIGFGCYVEPTFAGMGAAILAVEEQIKRKVRPWGRYRALPHAGRTGCDSLQPLPARNDFVRVPRFPVVDSGNRPGQGGRSGQCGHGWPRRAASGCRGSRLRGSGTRCRGLRCPGAGLRCPRATAPGRRRFRRCSATAATAPGWCRFRCSGPRLRRSRRCWRHGRPRRLAARRRHSADGRSVRRERRSGVGCSRP
jgi:hypothetical protein